MDNIETRAFQIAMMAEEAWVQELKRVYGKRYLDARYDLQLNSATPELKLLRSLKAKTALLHNEISDQMNKTKQVA